MRKLDDKDLITSDTPVTGREEDTFFSFPESHLKTNEQYFFYIERPDLN